MSRGEVVSVMPAFLFTVLVASWFCLPQDVEAQHFSVAAGLSADVKRFSGEPETSPLDTQSAGLQLSAGAFVTPHLILRLELGLERVSTVTRTARVLVPNPADVHTTYANRMRTVSTLVGFHPVLSGRFRWSVLGGLTFVHFERTITSTASPAALGATQATPSVFVDRVAAATVGMDGAVYVTNHFAIVPSIRAHAFKLTGDLAGFSVRPSIGGQWSF